MKRPREDKHAMRQENNILQQSSSLKGRTAVTVNGTTTSTPAPFPREWSSCHRRSRRSSPFLPTTLLAGCCFIAGLLFVTNSASFPSLPVADASRTRATSAVGTGASARAITGFDANHYFLRDQKDDFTFLRRLKRKKDKGPSDDDDEEEPLQQSSTSSSSSNAEECTVPAGVCTPCTFTEQKTYDACHETGRWQRFKCVFPGDSGTSEDEDDLRYEMMSCKHTPFDEGIAMFQFQIFCFLIGSLSLISVRKQKRMSASMFDRRKQQGANATRSNSDTSGSPSKQSGRRNSSIISDDDEEEIEFTPMTNQQRERSSLIANMEVI